MHSWALTLVLLAIPVPPGNRNDLLAPDDAWPQWRGPTGDSVAWSRNLPTTWGPEKNIVWKCPISGWGNSTPIISGDAIFLTTQDDDRLLLLRIGRASGKVVWQREVSTPHKGAKPDVYQDENNLASPSCVTDGMHVWAHFCNGALACYDFAGRQLWAINMVDGHGPFTVYYGHANSPVLYQNLLISQCVQNPKNGAKSYVVALDKMTGAEKWFVQRETDAKNDNADSYATPILCRRAGRAELIVMGGNVLDAYDPGSGKRLWYCSGFDGERTIAGPTLVGDTVLAVQGTGPLLAVRTGGKGDVSASHVRWKYEGTCPDIAGPVAANGLVFLADKDGTAHCLDAGTGAEVWSQKLEHRFRATPLVAGGHVYFFGKEGKATVVKAARKYEMVAQANLEEETLGSPAVAGNDLFLRARGHLYRIGVKGR